jgi:hypothetical protein
MFGWFQPRCPVASREKAWIEQRMRWLAAEFGLERARTAPVILPTPEFFPDAYNGTEADGNVVFERVCRYMGISPGPLRLEYYTGHRPLPVDGFQTQEGAAGLYEGTTWGTRVQVDAAALQDPLMLVATVAHELGHVLLLGQGRISPEEPDHEPLTDLLTVFLGLGVFTANTRVRSGASHSGTTETWSIQRLGYMSQEMTGYALALFARIREEENPAWARHLCLDVRTYFKKGLRYLLKTGDSLFDAEAGTFPMLSDDQLPPGFRLG